MEREGLAAELAAELAEGREGLAAELAEGLAEGLVAVQWIPSIPLSLLNLLNPCWSLHR